MEKELILMDALEFAVTQQPIVVVLALVTLVFLCIKTAKVE